MSQDGVVFLCHSDQTVSIGRDGVHTNHVISRSGRYAATGDGNVFKFRDLYFKTQRNFTISSCVRINVSVVRFTDDLSAVLLMTGRLFFGQINECQNRSTFRVFGNGFSDAMPISSAFVLNDEATKILTCYYFLLGLPKILKIREKAQNSEEQHWSSRTLKFGAKPNAAQLSPNGNSLWITTNDGIWLYDLVADASTKVFTDERLFWQLPRPLNSRQEPLPSTQCFIDSTHLLCLANPKFGDTDRKLRLCVLRLDADTRSATAISTKVSVWAADIENQFERFITALSSNGNELSARVEECAWVLHRNHRDGERSWYPHAAWLTCVGRRRPQSLLLSAHFAALDSAVRFALPAFPPISPTWGEHKYKLSYCCF